MSKVTSKAGLLRIGFRLLGNIDRLKLEGIPNLEGLDKSGVYAVVSHQGYTPNFIDQNDARRRGNVIHPWDIAKLEKKWVSGAEVLYIGKATNTLKERIRELVKHCRGRTSDTGPHKGGEILWQLKDYDRFEVLYLPTDNPQKTENKLLQDFKNVMKKLPFANRRLTKDCR